MLDEHRAVEGLASRSGTPIALMSTAVESGQTILFEKEKGANEPTVVRDVGEIETVGDVESLVAAKSIGVVSEDLQQTHVEGLESVGLGKGHAARVVVSSIVLHF